MIPLTNPLSNVCYSTGRVNGGSTGMEETGSRNSSLQRKKPPWLKLDIPTIQLTPDDTPLPNQVKLSCKVLHLNKKRKKD